MAVLPCPSVKAVEDSLCDASTASSVACADATPTTSRMNTALIFSQTVQTVDSQLIGELWFKYRSWQSDVARMLASHLFI